MTGEGELQEAKDAFKSALASGDSAALIQAERDIVRLRDLKAEQPTFFHDVTSTLVAWGEPEGPVQYSG